ncbi:phosphatidylserine decarboxylase [Actinomadura terrae]|uniref:phosphatidylserine decarboxylase n=1 Tax=Actinomadura terrae TaxID=604353 RepID=UPI001FA6B1C7|nr:phosphatidylserine decarboxylase [Actinomadura terrae]
MLTETSARSRTLEEFKDKLRWWYETDHRGFKTMFHAAMSHIVPPPPETKPEVWYDWKNASFEKLLNFFDEWYAWQPDVYSGLNYIQRFSWINYENDYGMVFLTSGPGLEMTEDFTDLQGDQMDAPASKDLADKWIAQLGSKMDDFYVPPGGFTNFNQFFVRRLVDQSKRPIAAADDAGVVVAPADCVINMIVDDLTVDTPIPVKTVTMNIRQLLNNSKYADKFVGGTAVSCILMPDMYHWYHTPVPGLVVESHDDIGGVYYGFRNLPQLLNKGNVGYGYDYQAFAEFRRGYYIIETTYVDDPAKPESFSSGYVGAVPVGLNSIASVQCLEEFRGIPSSQKPPVPVAKGQKIGNFQYGGSLNILLFEKNRFPALQLLQGQRIGLMERPERAEGLFANPWQSQGRRRGFLAL